MTEPDHCALTRALSGFDNDIMRGCVWSEKGARAETAREIRYAYSIRGNCNPQRVTVEIHAGEI